MHFLTPVWDLQLFRLINGQWRHWLLDFLMPLCSEQLMLVALLALALVWLVRSGGWRAGLAMLVLLASLGASDFAAQLIKKSAGRLRPLNTLEQTHYREDGEWRVRPEGFGPNKPRGTAYVSAHAANSMAAAVSAVVLWPRLGWWPLLLPLVVGWSRVYLGKHWPSDVAAGWLLGLGLALVVSGLWQWQAKAWKRRNQGADTTAEEKSLAGSAPENGKNSPT